MVPPYEITPGILKLITSIAEKMGEVNAKVLHRPSPNLRKQHRISTIHASLRIEGNTLSEEQITALLDKKRVIGPKKDITEVLNAVDVYGNLASFEPKCKESFLKAHGQLMRGLIANPGKYRKQGVGIVKGYEIKHLAPPSENVPFLMGQLFAYLKESHDPILIKSCVFHYEMEFIHPFLDGNGRMGRLWQTRILMDEYPIFEFLPFETIIAENPQEYYDALAASDKQGKSTKFIEYMLSVIDISMGQLVRSDSKKPNAEARLHYFISLNIKEFSRKDYLKIFKEISTATASRDLKKGVRLGMFGKMGEHNNTRYRVL